MKANTELKRVLTLFPVVLFGLAYMVPLTVFSTYGIVSQITKGLLPAAYVVTLLAMLFTAFSYGRMVKAFPYAGSAYTYTQKALGSHTGFYAGWILLLDYLFLPMINYLLIGIYLNAEFPAVPTWVWIMLAVALVTFINIRGIKLVANVNFLLILFQVIFVIMFIILSIKTMISNDGLQSLFSITPFFSADSSLTLVFSGAAILCLSFLGFDAVTTVAEETVDAKKTIPKAIFLVTLIGGGLFIFVSYLGQLIFPDYTAFIDPDSAGLEIAMFLGGGIFKAIFLTAYILGCVASATSSHASVSRLLYAMGRDAVLPKKVFGYISPKYRTPVLSTLVVSLAALAALIFSLETVSSFISFGALAAFTFVHMSVISHYFIKSSSRTFKTLTMHLLIPAIGIVLCLWLWTSLSSYAFMLGISWIVIGTLYLAYLTKMFREKPPILNFDQDDENKVS